LRGEILKKTYKNMLKNDKGSKFKQCGGSPANMGYRVMFIGIAGFYMVPGTGIEPV
jgi:hypothetical protein